MGRWLRVGPMLIVACGLVFVLAGCGDDDGDQVEPIGLGSQWTALESGTTYLTSTELEANHELSVTPSISGWQGQDVVSCEGPGSLRLRNDSGRIFVVYNPGLTVDEAMEALRSGPYLDPSEAESTIGERSGRQLGAVLADGVDSTRLGGRTSTLLPHFDLTEDVIDPGAIEGGYYAEAHVVTVDPGVLTIAFVTDAALGAEGMEAFRSDAMGLAKTIGLTVVTADDATC